LGSVASSTFRQLTDRRLGQARRASGASKTARSTELAQSFLHKSLFLAFLFGQDRLTVKRIEG
jgi:hypothetical protein